MDMQGKPIGSTNQGMKNTSDPERYTNPIQEGAGPVASDSLAAESARSGGKFASNRGSEPLSVKGANSTLNNTDTSAAITLAPAPDAHSRAEASNESGREEKYPEGAGGQGDSAGSHAGGSSGGEGHEYRESRETSSDGGAAGADPGKTSSSGAGSGNASNGGSGGNSSSGSSGGDTTYNTSYGGGDHNKPGLSGGNNADVDAAPGYVAGVTQPFNQGKPKGKNITEEDFDGPTTQDAEIGSEQDPGRKAEGDFQRMTQSASGSTAPRQGAQSGEAGPYDVLKEEQSL
ncbi:MAG: hypothetical protein Q9217_000076 [Psora testacea]